MNSITEHCLLCSSKNKILIDSHSQAWECWNCNTSYWIDDQARLEYMVYNQVTSKEAERDLKRGLPYFAIVGDFCENS